MTFRSLRPVRRVARLAALSVVLGSSAWAQAPATTFGDLERKVGVGDRVSVTDVTGQVREGRLRAIDSASLTLDTTPFPVDMVATVEKRGSREIGRRTLRGLGHGASVGFLLASLWSYGHYHGDLPHPALSDMGDLVLGSAVVGTVVGFVRGVFLPGKNRRVYVAPPANPEGGALAVVPVVSSDRQGVTLRYSF